MSALGLDGPDLKSGPDTKRQSGDYRKTRIRLSQNDSCINIGHVSGHGATNRSGEEPDPRLSREYRDILYVLDRGHGLQAPCGESGSDCGFSAGFAGLQIHDSRRRSRGNVGIPAGISKGCGKGGKPAYGFPCFPYPAFPWLGRAETALSSLLRTSHQASNPAQLKSSDKHNPNQCLQLAYRTNRIGLHGSTSRQIARQHRHRSQQQHNPKYRHRIIGADPV